MFLCPATPILLDEKHWLLPMYYTPSWTVRQMISTVPLQLQTKQRYGNNRGPEGIRFREMVAESEATLKLLKFHPSVTRLGPDFDDTVVLELRSGHLSG